MTYATVDAYPPIERASRSTLEAIFVWCTGEEAVFPPPPHRRRTYPSLLALVGPRSLYGDVELRAFASWVRLVTAFHDATFGRSTRDRANLFRLAVIDSGYRVDRTTWRDGGRTIRTASECMDALSCYLPGNDDEVGAALADFDREHSLRG